jgi:formylglycine-generating enzyme required for sulfatase activity
MRQDVSTSHHRRFSLLPYVVMVVSVAFLTLWILHVADRNPSAPAPAELAGGTSNNESTLDIAKSEVTLPAPPPQSFPRLIDINGVIQQPGGNRETVATVFVFLATHCPISNSYLPELNRLHAHFSSKQVEFYCVLCDQHTTQQNAAEHQREYNIAFPVLLDRTRTLQRRLKPTHTPQAVVVNKAGTVIYTGRIDDRYRELARPRPRAQRRELADALLAVTAGRQPKVAHAKPVGCLLEPVDDTVTSQDVTFCRDVAPIIFANCTSCHRTGEATPFPLASYTDVRRRAAQVLDVVERRIMPPWKPKPGFGHFLNEQRLTDDEIKLIQRWVANGAPPGDRANLPATPRFAKGWQLGEPDLIIEMPEAFDVPADGPDIYQHFVLPTGLTEDRLVAAFEYRPGNASVVHHSWLYFDDQGEARKLDAKDPAPGYRRFGGPGFVPAGNLGGWGPGGTPRRLPDRMGRPIPKHSDLVLQIHYHPTGKPERDRSRIGLYFAPQTSQRRVAEIMVADVNLEIPAGAKRHLFRASYTLPVDTTLLDTSPHMHLLGRKIQVTATTPAGQVVPLVRIDDWNFYWQDHYVYRQPIRLPAGTQLKLVAEYDNSNGNPHNPNSPPRTVRFGERSGDEMGLCYFQVITDRPADLDTLTQHASEHFAAMMERFAKQTSSPRQITNRFGMEFAHVPAGEFQMGTTDPERFAPHSRCETPAHRVRLSQPLWFGRHEVTVGQFRKFVEATSFQTDAERSGEGANGLDVRTKRLRRNPDWIWSSPGFKQTDRHPVVCVSHRDARAFCRWLSEADGWTYRLPSEAEWEYACRAQTDTLFFSGDNASDLKGVANTADASLRKLLPAVTGTAAWNDRYPFTAPVGSFRPNAFGLHDMHGNVGEWCADWYDARFYRESPSTNPTGPLRATNWRTVRGGSWYNTPTSCRSSGRHDGILTARSMTNGFRVVAETGED